MKQTEQQRTAPARPHLDASGLRLAIRQAQVRNDAARLVHRLDGVLLVAQGQSCGSVARWFGVDCRTVQRWVHNAEQPGLQGLAEHHHGGRARLLDAGLCRRLAQDLAVGPHGLGYAEQRWSGKRLAQHLQRVYGVQMGLRSCQRLLALARRG